uniref:CD99 antigen n=1 Tax=Equus asinus TaxID=9793 RepID=A0A9L0K345_EQUAS
MARRAVLALLLVSLLGLLVSSENGDLDLSDALLEDDKKPTPPPPKKPGADDDFNLEDALGGGGSNDPAPPAPPKPRPPPNPNQPGSSGGFSDSDLVDGDSGGAGGGGGGGHGGQGHGSGEQADSPGVVPGIVGAVVVAVAGAISSFIAYQKKKLCFKENGKASPLLPSPCASLTENCAFLKKKKKKTKPKQNSGWHETRGRWLIVCEIAGMLGSGWLASIPAPSCVQRCKLCAGYSWSRSLDFTSIKGEMIVHTP